MVEVEILRASLPFARSALGKSDVRMTICFFPQERRSKMDHGTAEAVPSRIAR